MANSNQYQLNPELDLTFERIVDIPPEKIWAAWTTPELLMPWGTSKNPHKITEIG